MEMEEIRYPVQTRKEWVYVKKHATKFREGERCESNGVEIILGGNFADSSPKCLNNPSRLGKPRPANLNGFRSKMLL